MVGRMVEHFSGVRYKCYMEMMIAPAMVMPLKGRIHVSNRHDSKLRKLVKTTDEDEE